MGKPRLQSLFLFHWSLIVVSCSCSAPPSDSLQSPTHCFCQRWSVLEQTTIVVPVFLSISWCWPWADDASVTGHFTHSSAMASRHRHTQGRWLVILDSGTATLFSGGRSARRSQCRPSSSLVNVIVRQLFLEQPSRVYLLLSIPYSKYDGAGLVQGVFLHVWLLC